MGNGDGNGQLDGHVIHLANGRMQPDTPRQKVKEIVRAAVAQGGAGGIVVHFHGGLVNLASGLETARRLAPVYEDAGAYPVFFVWESGLIESLENNLGEIVRESFFGLVWKKLSEIAMRKFAQSPANRTAGTLPAVDAGNVHAAIDAAIAADDSALLATHRPAPPATVSELSVSERLALEKELLKDPILAMEVTKISNGLRDPADIELDVRSRAATVRGSSTTLMDPKALDRLVDRPDPSARGALTTLKVIKAVVTIAARVIKRFVRSRDHGFHATLVEEILRELYIANVGELVWSTMKKDTADSFGDDAGVYGGTAFLAALAEEIDPAHPPKITLVGHSTGAVYISEFLEKAHGMLPAGVKFGVVFLAPASTFEKTAATLEQHADRIAGYRMFTMNDSEERDDVLVKVVYPHSLLYFISGVLEGSADFPVVGMARFYDEALFPVGEDPAIDRIRAYLDAVDGRVAWSVTPPGTAAGRASTCEHHGEFDNDETTLESVAHLVEFGF